MAKLHRRIERQIKGAVKKLKRGEVPFPPPPQQMSAAEQEQFWTEMAYRKRAVQANLKSLSTDSSRAGHKKRLRLDAELSRIDELLTARGQSNEPSER